MKEKKINNDDKLEDVIKTGKNIAKKGKKLAKLKVSLGIVVSIALVVIIVVAFVIPSQQSKPSDPVIDPDTDLIDLINLNQINTLKMNYTGVTVVTVERKLARDLEYYVKYDATVKAGFDANQVKSEKKEDNGVMTITITLPEITFSDPSIDIKTIQFMNEDKSYSGHMSDALKECKKDIKRELESDELIKDTAKANAVNQVKAAVLPFLQNAETDELKYKLEVK